MKLELKKPSLLRPGPKTEGYLLSAMNLWNTPLSLWGLSQVTTAKDAEILDIGCGGGKTVSRLLKKAPEGHVYGMDSSFRAVDFSWRLNEEAIREGRCQIIEGSADSLPFDDNRFDLVLAEETFYFWKDPEACLKEVYRVLKPGGQFLLLHSKGAMPPDKIYEKLIPHMKVYSKKELKEYLEDAGFRNVTSRSKLSALTVTSVKPLSVLDQAKKRLKLSPSIPYGKLTAIAVSAAALGLAAYGASRKRK